MKKHIFLVTSSRADYDHLYWLIKNLVKIDKFKLTLLVKGNHMEKKLRKKIEGINNSSEIIFHVTGKNKSDVIDEIINERGDYKSYPASYIKPSFGKLSWYLDFDAAKNLTK